MAQQRFITTITATLVVALSACSSNDQADFDSQLSQNRTPATQDSIGNIDSIVSESASDQSNRSAQPAAIRQKALSSNQIQGQGQGQGQGQVQPLPQRQVVTAPMSDAQYQPEQKENYAPIDSSSIVLTSNEPTSTFSIDVDTGAYANARRFLNAGSLPPQVAVRVEEMINYFDYDYPQPDSLDTPFSITTEMATTPWNKKTHLLHVGLNGYDVNPSDRPAANLVFLIDVSGSMSAPGKLGLVKPAMQMLVNQLNEQDTVSIAVYAGASGVVLEPTAGDKKTKINQAIQSLQSSGSTNGEAGIELAYSLANENKKPGSANRVILVTDGDFNVGLSDIDQLKSLIEQRRKSGIALTTLGFGQGNYNDHLMEQLADVGNGAYAYIDTLNEARKVLSEELTGTLLTIAKDVKIQIEFNPAVVSEYRLIGYENRALANEDFANDKIDAGEIGAGHSVTALYEVALVGSGGERNTPRRYAGTFEVNRNLDEVAELRIRYKKPEKHTSQLILQQIAKDNINDDATSTSENFNFSAAVAAFGQHLRDGKYLNDFNLDNMLALAKLSRGDDPFGYRQEFINLVRLAKSLGDITESSTVQPKQQGTRG